MIDFYLFCVYKNFSPKKAFCINVNNNDSHRQKTTCTFYIYKKQKNCEMFIYIYKKPDILQKTRQFALRFCSQKARHFTLRSFSWMFWNCKKEWHFALRDVFIFKKLETSKKKDNLHYVFLYTKSLTFCVTRFFMEFLKLAEGGGIFIHKKNALCVQFLYPKINAISMTFLYTKSHTLCVIF